MQINTSSTPQSSSFINTDAEKLYLQEAAQDFLNSEDMLKRIRTLIGRGSRLNLNIDELRQFNPKLANYILKNPIQAIKMFEDHLNSQIKTLKEDGMNSKAGNEKQAQATSDMNFPQKVLSYHVNFEGNFGINHVTPRGLKSNLVN